MPTIRDGRGQLHTYDMGVPPPGSPSGPVERLVEPSMVRVPDAKPTHDYMAASRARGAVRGGFVKGQRKPAPPAAPAAEERAATGGAAHQVVKLPRDRDERARAVLEAVRTSSSHAEAGEKLGVGGQRIAQFVSDLRRAGELPADVEMLLRARSGHRGAVAAPKPLEGQEASVPATDAAPEPASPTPAAVETTPPDPPARTKGIPCRSCSHAAVCSIRPKLEFELARTPPMAPDPAITLHAQIDVTCAHYLEVAS